MVRRRKLKVNQQKKTHKSKSQMLKARRIRRKYKCNKKKLASLIKRSRKLRPKNQENRIRIRGLQAS